MSKHSGGIVGNQSVNTDRSSALDPGWIVHSPNCHLQTGNFGFLDQPFSREAVVWGKH